MSDQSPIAQLKRAAEAASNAMGNLERDLEGRREAASQVAARMSNRQWDAATGVAVADDLADAQDAVTLSGLREQIRNGEASLPMFKRRAFEASERWRNAIADDLVSKAAAADIAAHAAVRSLFPLLEQLQDGFRAIEGAVQDRRTAFRAISAFESDTGTAGALLARARRPRVSQPDYVQTRDRQGKRKAQFAYLDDPESAVEALAERVDDELMHLALGGDMPEMLARWAFYRNARDGVDTQTVERHQPMRQLIEANDAENERLVMGG